jgi:hypothetical protein
MEDFKVKFKTGAGRHTGKWRSGKFKIMISLENGVLVAILKNGIFAVNSK